MPRSVLPSQTESFIVGVSTTHVVLPASGAVQCSTSSPGGLGPMVMEPSVKNASALGTRHLAHTIPAWLKTRKASTFLGTTAAAESVRTVLTTRLVSTVSDVRMGTTAPAGFPGTTKTRAENVPAQALVQQGAAF